MAYYFDDFEEGESVGGATGSVKAKHKKDGWFGQVKQSIVSALFARQIKAGGLDKENYAEFIAASMLGEPEVDFVIDKKTGQVGIVSKYLSDVTGQLLNDKNTQLIVSNSPKEAHEITLEQKKQICYGIANSIYVGDHDINPQNFLKTKHGIKRIDFGHAFNDLISASRIFGGGVRNKNNQVLDFLNRENVNTIKLNDSSKLWRSYAKLIPSLEMAEAMEQVANESTQKIERINKAKKKFKALLEINNTPPINKKHVLSSLVATANNLGPPLVKIDLEDPDKTINTAFKKIEDFSKKQGQDLQKTARLMKAQVQLNELIKRGKAQIGEADFESWKTEYQDIANNPKTVWIKQDKKIKAFEGSLTGYIKHQQLRMFKLQKYASNVKSIIQEAKFVNRNNTSYKNNEKAMNTHSQRAV